MSTTTEVSPPDPRRVLAVAAGAAFIAFLDVTVVNIAFPDLSASFTGSSLPTLSWIISAYAIAFAAMLTAAGRVADDIGRRPVFLAGLQVFVLASAACAVAPSVEILLVGRVVQGVAAAAMIPSALGLVLAATPPAHRMAAVGAWGAAGSVAAAAGPAIGGFLVEGFGWRAAFLVNLPIGALLIFGAVRVLPTAPRAGRAVRPDVPGTFAFAAGVGLLVAALTQSSQWGWADTRTIAVLLGGAASTVFALLRSRRQAAPAVEVGLWRHRSFAVASIGSATFGAAVFAWLLSGPLLLTGVWDYSVLEAGLAVSPGALTSAAASFYVGQRATPTGQRAAITGGSLALVLCGLALVLFLDDQPAFWALWLPCGLVSGAAIGAALTGLSVASASALPPTQFAAGTGLTMTARQVGGAVGVAGLASILAAGAIDAATFSTLFAACAAAAFLTSLTGLALIGRSVPPDVRPAAATGAQA